jgi:hypothetical protein
LTFSTKAFFALLILGFCSVSLAAEIMDLRVPLKINSDFSFRTEEGPPASSCGLNQFGPSYIFQFAKSSYRREISFSSKDDYIILTDFYGNYKLSTYQTMSLTNFVNFRRGYALNDSWKNDLSQSVGSKDTDPNKAAVQLNLPDLPDWSKGIVGEGRSNIKVTGSRSISFSGRSEWEDNLVNTGTFKQSKFPTLQMIQQSRFKVTGTIGSKISVEVDQDSQRQVDLANTIKLRYQGNEDDILQTIEAGNTNLSLPNAQFIGYSQNVQGLFGIKSTAKIGKLDLTMITSQEKGSTEKASFNAGAKGAQDTIRDYQYLANTYFWLGDHQTNDTIISVELYYAGSTQNRDPYGFLCVNPRDSLPYYTVAESLSNEYIYSPVKLYDPTTFEIYKRNWFIVLDQPLGQGSILGAYIKFQRWNGGHADTLTIGNLNYRPNNGLPGDTTLVLRLIKHSNPDPAFETWNLMWRNVYDLQARNISAQGFDLKIYRDIGQNVNNPEDQDKVCFITLLGLDSLNNSGGSGPDCIFDFNNTLLDAVKGHLIFPSREPFNSPALQVKVPSIYRKIPGDASLPDSSKYYIAVKSSQRSNSFSLGRANIMPGTEVVKLGDGTVLKRGVDYDINYDIGQITFLSDQASNPAANVSVDYEFAPFFAPEKKSLFGMAGQYNLWDNSNISLAGMYRSETASDPRPRVGREPNHGLVWDSNFQLSFKPQFITTLVDALPLVEADAPSQLDISGEVAESFPDPNTKNVAYIDDFEGTRDYTDLTQRRSIWTQCSPPLDSANATYPLNEKGKIWWYNPIDPIPITAIWPERQVTSTDNRQDVLWLQYFPDDTLAHPESSWAGIMRPLYTGLADQSRTKYIEIWFHPDSLTQYDDPTLHIDLGQISEDLNNDEILNSEDRATAGAVGVFEPDQEDTGLDGLFDQSEPGYSADTLPDPNHDDWYYHQDDDYSHINGTEGNRDDPDRRGRFDTEDINNNNTLDRANGFFEYTVHLDSSKYMVDSTFYANGGGPTGWKLIRIPFRDTSAYDTLGLATTSFQRILFARLWFNGTSHPYKMGIASIQLVGNKWQEIPDSSAAADQKFEVSVKNTQENSNYYPPPGVAGTLNPTNNIREKEQSLVLGYENMEAGQIRGAYCNLNTPEDYTLYQRMQMFVHGDTTAQSGKIRFFLRLSSDGVNYYEYHTVLEDGWTVNNDVDIDFAKMTELKYEFQKNHPTPPPADTLNPGAPDTTDGHYSIKGNPALSQIKWFIAGVEIDTSAAPGDRYSGEVWIDELRVTDVRRNSDYAGRIQADLKFSDFMDLGMSYSRTGANFVPLSAKTSQGATNTSESARLAVRVDKLFPPSMGFSLPASVSWTKSVALPRLMSGSDIILQPSDRQLERTENKNISLTASESFNKNTKNWFWNLTLNRIKTSYTYSKADGFSPSSPVNNRTTYRGSGSYDLTPRAKPGFKPFFWTKYLFMPKSIYDSKLLFLPTQLSMSSEVNGSSSTTVTRDITNYSRVRDLSLNASGAYNIFSTLRASYNVTGNRDISQPGRFKMSIDPSKIKLGREESFQQRFESAYSPRILKFIDNSVSYSSSFAENADIRQNPDSTRSAQMSSTIKADMTFNFQNLLPGGKSGGGGNGGGGGGGGVQPDEPNPDQGMPNGNKGDSSNVGSPSGRDKINRNRQPGNLGGKAGKSNQQDNNKEESNGPGFGSPKWIFGRFVNLFRSIKPIRGSYLTDKKFNTQGLLWRPSWRYMFGITQNVGVPIKSSNGIARPNQSIFSDTYTLDSGLQPWHGIDVTSGYSLRKTVTTSSTDPVLSNSVTFPDVTVNISGLEKWPLFHKFTSSVGLQSGFSKKVDENGRADTGELYTRATAKQFAPLAAFSLAFKNSIRTSIRYDLALGLSENLRQEGQTNRNVNSTDGTFKISFSYSFTAPQGIKLPLLKMVKFNSQLSMNIDITIKNSKSQSISNGKKSIDAQRSEFMVEPRLTYQFSKAISGGVNATWDDSNDKIQQRKHHIRELGITAEIKF